MTDAPHPRVLFEDVSNELFSELAPLVGTAKQISHDDPIHASDWDLLVTCAYDAGVRDLNLHVLSFGAERLDPVVRGGSGAVLARLNITYARGADVAHGTPPELSQLLQRTVLSQEFPEEKNTWSVPWAGYYWAVNDPAWQNETTGDLGGACVPLLHVGQEQFVYALHRRRSVEEGSKSLCWALPDETVGHREWLLHILQVLREHEPARFPSDPLWQTREDWASPEVASTMRRIATLDAAHEAAQAEYENVRSGLLERLESEVEASNRGVWRLLTAQGTNLVEAVAVVLTELGFVVSDMDEHHDAKTGAKLEDLRVRDAHVGGWECLVEVKGYAKGAKVNDVPQITGRPSVQYAAEKGQAPSTVWHIVNTFISTDPSGRPVAIPSNIDLAPLTEADGALIDSRDLFLAWRAFRKGTCDADIIRRSLREAVTRWLLPSASAEEGK